MLPCRWRRDPAARRPGQQPGPHEVRLGDLFDGLALFADGDGQGAEPDRAAPELADERLEHRAVEAVESERVDVVDGQRSLRRSPVDDAGAAHLGEVAHPAQQPVGDSRRPPRASGDLDGTVGLERHARAAQPTAPGST